MSLVLRRSYMKAKNIVVGPGHITVFPAVVVRGLCDDVNSSPEFINSTIFLEKGMSVQELPVIIRKLKDFSEINNIDQGYQTPVPKNPQSYSLIQAEFSRCVDFRDVFSLLSKCLKITPDIALGAIERIYQLENDTSIQNMDSKIFHVNLAKGAILDKLLKILIKTEDTQTILNILNTMSTFIDPYKYKFCDELLSRTVDNKLSIEQLIEFTLFLVSNKSTTKYSNLVDKLWVGFIEKEKDITEQHLVRLVEIIPKLKQSKKTLFKLLEQKLSELWFKIDIICMQEILNVYMQERYFSYQSFTLIGRWLNTNIHKLDEDSLLDIITKFTKLNFSDNQVEKSVIKYMRLKGDKINSPVLIVGILNYCIQFQLRNEIILNACSNYFYKNCHSLPTSFMKSYIYPNGFLYFDPCTTHDFWTVAEEALINKFQNLCANDLCSIVMSYIYVGKYPLKLVNQIFRTEYLSKIKDLDILKNLQLIDTALSLECKEYPGPLLPKEKWSDSVMQDSRIKNIIKNIHSDLVAVAGGNDKMSTSVLIPHLNLHDTYLIDVMFHETGIGGDKINWKSKSVKNQNLAILIHLPEHYCSDDVQLIGPQVMRIKHLRLLGLRVTSLKYSVLSQLYTTKNSKELTDYIDCNIRNAKLS